MSQVQTTVGEVQNRGIDKSRACEFVAAVAVYTLGAVVLFSSAPHDGEFWWSDAPRHALNGAFVKDFLTAFPWRDPRGFAIQYYMQYPALTILLYPPFFYVSLAIFYLVFGVSHATALNVELGYYVAFALGTYLLARRWLEPWLALVVGLSVMAAPGISLWGRQVMLEIPTLACSVWGLLLLRRYVQSQRPLLCYLGGLILVFAIYHKITAIFLLPVVASMAFAANDKMIFKDWHAWITAVLSLCGLIPIIALTLKFGHANIESVTGVRDAIVGRDTLSGWLWYAEHLPDQLGWPVITLAIFFPIFLLAGYRPRNFGRPDVVLLLGWLLIGYVFFSAIDLKEARHTTLILPPILLASFFTIDRVLPRHFVVPAALLLCAMTAYSTARYYPVPFVSGYREAAMWIEENAPKDAVIVFSGYRDGSFIFNMRTLEDRLDLYTVRADKLLLDVAVRRELGVKEKTLDTSEIGALLDRIGTRYVVAQSDFWTDLGEMAKLQAVLRSDHFLEVARIPVVSNVGTEDKELRIYGNRHPVNSGGAPLELNLPIIGRKFQGKIGGAN